MASFRPGNLHEGQRLIQVIELSKRKLNFVLFSIIFYCSPFINFFLLLEINNKWINNHVIHSHPFIQISKCPSIFQNSIIWQLSSSIHYLYAISLRSAPIFTTELYPKRRPSNYFKRLPSHHHMHWRLTICTIGFGPPFHKSIIDLSPSLNNSSFPLCPFAWSDDVFFHIINYAEGFSGKENNRGGSAFLQHADRSRSHGSLLFFSLPLSPSLMHSYTVNN